MGVIDPSPFEIYKQAADERQRRVRLQIQSRRDRAWEVARTAAGILHSDFSVTKVVAFGSLTQAALFHLHSDVDLAVWGLDGRAYFRAVGILQGIDREIGVDLIIYDEASPALRFTIDRDGVVL